MRGQPPPPVPEHLGSVWTGSDSFTPNVRGRRVVDPSGCSARCRAKALVGFEPTIVGSGLSLPVTCACDSVLRAFPVGIPLAPARHVMVCWVLDLAGRRVTNLRHRTVLRFLYAIFVFHELYLSLFDAFTEDKSSVYPAKHDHRLISV